MKKEKPRNGGRWTEARYWAAVRAALRRGFRYWKPAVDAKMEARRPSKSKNKRLKWEYQCNQCKKWWPDKHIQIDHIVPVGQLKCEEHLVAFLKRLTPEEGFQVLCKTCHKIKTEKEREDTKNQT